MRAIRSTGQKARQRASRGSGQSAGRFAAGSLAAIAVCAVLSCFCGCGTPAAPQPPSLKLPDLVNDLAAVRNGNRVTLHWTMPKRTTDRLLIESQIRGPVAVRVCRRETIAHECETAGEVFFAPGATGEFQETLPAPQAVGDPRKLPYFVELKSPKGRSAGLSNAAEVLAGSAPAPIEGLTAEVRADGVALRWAPEPAATGARLASIVRLHRKLLTIESEKKKAGPMQPGPEAPDRDLLVEPAIGDKPLIAALDSSARFGENYQYAAQRIDRVIVNGKTLELAGEISSPIQVNVVDTFPPAVPRGLVAVFVPEEKTIDLSWEPDSEADLAGYIVYRTEFAQQAQNTQPAHGQRISGAQPLTGPAYRDATVQPGHTYHYAVTATDLTGHESKQSAEAIESVPEATSTP